ncbi:hypothetical protein KR018_006894 [Drosophila ironensis]|nr:hypothetical protein KR018_006894 [Drosophila ironensis]
MAQKKAVAAKAQKQTPKRVNPKAAKPVEKEEEEQVLPVQTPSKKQGKKLPPKQVETSSEGEDEDVEEEEDSSSEAGALGGLIDDEAEEDSNEDDDDEEEDDDDEDDDELEPGQVSLNGGKAAESEEDKEDDDDDEEEDEDDEAPAEAPIAKAQNGEAAKKGGIPKIPAGRIPPGTPNAQIVHVNNLPDGYKHKDVIALFTKFGPVAVVHRLKTLAAANTALIAFESEAGAKAALAAKPKSLKLGANELTVSPARDKVDANDRTVVVGLIGTKVTRDDLKTQFEKVAGVESVFLNTHRSNPKAFVRLLSAEDVPKVLKLHSTEMFGRFITVRPTTKENGVKSPELTLVVENTGKVDSFSCNALEKIFKKHGEVDFIDLLCSAAILAFVTYKQPEQATKAFNQLNGKTVDGLELKVKRFSPKSSNKATLVTNLHAQVTEEDLRGVFAETGEIESVQLFGHKAVVTFATEEAFCKSFLLNETLIHKQPIFLEPNSVLKYRLSKKRPAPFTPNGNSPGGKFQKFQKPNNFGKKPFNKRPNQNDDASKPFVKKAKKF